MMFLLVNKLPTFANEVIGMKTITMATPGEPIVTPYSAESFSTDVQFLEASWKRAPGCDVPVIDFGRGEPLVFVPIHEHLEFVYARQVRAFSGSRRVILYRRQESRTKFVSRSDRVEELREVVDCLAIRSADFVAHGDAAMVLAEFALRYPERCRSVVLVGLGADYRIAPHPLIWILHEIFLRLPIEGLVPTSLLLRTIMRYITHFEAPGQAQAVSREDSAVLTEIPRALIEGQFRKIAKWPAMYRYSVLPVIHSFDIRGRVAEFEMPILLINRWDDALAPEAKTAWLAHWLPNCVYHVVPGRGRFFMYSEAQRVNPIIEQFLAAQSEASRLRTYAD
ncbi:MAG TPA: alpha/beta hydrolase [Terriglobales bacterium]|nr:alpha/beta hydrolase [Terriglobales bacterium]